MGAIMKKLMNLFAFLVLGLFANLNAGDEATWEVICKEKKPGFLGLKLTNYSASYITKELGTKYCELPGHGGVESWNDLSTKGKVKCKNKEQLPNVTKTEGEFFCAGNSDKDKKPRGGVESWG